MDHGVLGVSMMDVTDGRDATDVTFASAAVTLRVNRVPYCAPRGRGSEGGRGPA
ncbi:hypothetical protein ACIHFE_26080 [Streptomyces sp. NPDC052396]|uniref:hypothetical protein n=1 Tax=Streptomyces sp. NPDC052396 TaxID=3365689 RepID=UPI0037D3FCA7